MKTVQHYIYRLLAGVTLPLLLWSVTACKADRGERSLEGETYLGVALRGNSINEDQQLFEDKVGNVTMLVFPVGRMECTANVRVNALGQGTVSKIPPTKVLQGMNDLYFIANVPDDGAELQGVLTRAQIEDYLYKVRSFTADPKVKGLPMARVYRNQMIGEGTEQAPFMFKPNTTGNNTPFVPVSNFDLNSLKVTDSQDVVGLVRSCAKISITFTGEGVDDIESVQCYNVAQDFSFAQLPEGSTYQQVAAPINITIDNSATSTNTKEGHIYVPERLFKSTEMPEWSDANKDKITYVKLQMKSGRELLIPIAHNASEAIEESGNNNYLQFVTGKKAGKDGLKPNFDIVRNMHYALRVKLSSDANQVDVSLRVMPWTLVASNFFYTRPQYKITVETPEGVQAPSNIGKDILLHDKSEATITFTIQEPKGGLWVATLTNALEYELVGERSGVIYPGAQSYTMQVKPKAGFENKPRYTQFFITVNGREIYLGDLSTAPGGKGLFFDEVPQAKRWQFKQVE